MKIESRDLNENLNNQNSDVKTPKQKFFIIFKLVNSLLYFVPAILVFGFGVMMNLFIMIVSAGASKNMDTSGTIEGMTIIGAFSIIPAILCLIVLIITIISTVKFFKNKYSKVMDMLIAIIFLLLDIALLGVGFYFGFIVIGIIAAVSGGIMLYNIIDIIREK